MTFIIKIKRCRGTESPAYRQSFSYDGGGNTSVAAVLKELNRRRPLLDTDGSPAPPIDWECGCFARKCGACAMRINGRPQLACSAFLSEMNDRTITLEPLGKFPVVSDLTVDRSCMFESLKQIRLWLEEDACGGERTHEERYQAARCLMCGCCLEICPNFSPEGNFAGAAAAVAAFRILDQTPYTEHWEEIAARYKKLYFEGCGKSLACHDICPAGLPVEELIVRSNAAAVWKK